MDDFWTDFVSQPSAASSLDDLVVSLNPAQRSAVEQIEGPLLILAGPGSGKTRVITHRIAYMIASGIPSHQIVALTFTNKAANEMKSRLSALSPNHLAWTSTFHKFSARMLRMHAGMVGLSENFTIYDSQDSKRLLKQAIENTRIDVRHHSADKLSSHVSSLKNRGILADEFQPRPGAALDSILAEVYPEYQKLLKHANAVDFDDLLLYCVELLRDNPELRQSYDEKYSYFMVDEYQDTNAAQYQLIRLLNYNVRNLAVTGDPDQSIYGWRGADIRNILNFEQDFPAATKVRLEQNYRSTKAILRVADQLIANNVRRKHKSLHTENEEGKKVRMIAYHSPKDEANDIADSIALGLRQGRKPGDFAIFYRANWLSRSLEHSLRATAIPYQVINGHEFYQRKEIKDLIAYLHLLNNPSDTIAFERIINVPRRKIGKVTVSRIRDFAMENNISLMEAAQHCEQIEAIKKAPRSKIKAFVKMYEGLLKLSHGTVESIIRAVVDGTGYRDWLTEDESDEGYERARNVDELIVAAREFDNDVPGAGLDAYLEQAALVSDTDAMDSDGEYVSLMTLHASKGLEFPVVFLVGLEDGILPHERSAEDDESVEEERRLMFVGITRAQQELQISRCNSRFRRGSFWPSIASRFLMELPREEMEVFEPRSFGRPSSNPWDDDDVYDEFPEEEFEKEYVARQEEEPDEISFDVEALEAETEVASELNSESELSAGNDLPDSVAEKIDPATKLAKVGLAKMMTASQLAEKQKSLANVSNFKVGQVVEHPEYGIGLIEKLTGRGPKRMVTIDFTQVGSKTFRIAFANLTIKG